MEEELANDNSLEAKIEREVLKVKQLKIKDKNELKFKGRYERIFPLENEALLRYP